jgi:hypothetical protein
MRVAETANGRYAIGWHGLEGSRFGAYLKTSANLLWTSAICSVMWTAERCAQQAAPANNPAFCNFTGCAKNESTKP